MAPFHDALIRCDLDLNLQRRPLLTYFRVIILGCKISEEWAFILLFIFPVHPNTVTDNWVLNQYE